MKMPKSSILFNQGMSLLIRKWVRSRGWLRGPPWSTAEFLYRLNLVSAWIKIGAHCPIIFLLLVFSQSFVYPRWQCLKLSSFAATAFRSSLLMVVFKTFKPHIASIDLKKTDEPQENCSHWKSVHRHLPRSTIERNPTHRLRSGSHQRTRLSTTCPYFNVSVSYRGRNA